MKKLIIVFLFVIAFLVAGVWFWSVNKNNIPPEQQITTGVYHDEALGFSITLPTSLSSTTDSTLYKVDPLYEYTAMGPGKSIPGVRFTIPSTLASGTNLSSDSYVSVEHLSGEQKCDATEFMGIPSVKSEIIRDGDISYSFTSSSGAAAGNRYDEYVYVRPDLNICIAVRYFIHSTAIENYPEGARREFDKGSLIREFDEIRRTLVLR